MDKQRVYVLEHVHDFEDGHEDVKLIGVFSSQAKAEAALERLRDQPGFRDIPEGFAISEHEMDSDDLGWPDGYATVRPGEYLPDDKSFRAYFSDFEVAGSDIYFECGLCGSACPTTGMPGSHRWQCACGNLSVLNKQRIAKGGDETVKIFRLK